MCVCFRGFRVCPEIFLKVGGPPQATSCTTTNALTTPHTSSIADKVGLHSDHMQKRPVGKCHQRLYVPRERELCNRFIMLPMRLQQAVTCCKGPTGKVDWWSTAPANAAPSYLDLSRNGLSACNWLRSVCVLVGSACVRRVFSRRACAESHAATYAARSSTSSNSRPPTGDEPPY